ncbi:MAG: hypothetical protein LAP39_00165 [Acidobacteriia bacterium]|nr:hypothetical protein [Terriglobia bacterium]
MKPAPPKAIETIVGTLLPPACREEVLGDLHERFTSPRQYIADAMFTVPCVVASRIRRTTDARVLGMEAFTAYLSFLCAAWQWAGTAFLAEQWGLVRLAIPTVSALVALMLRRAYADPARRSRWAPFVDAAVGAGGAVLSQAALWNIDRELVLPRWMLISGSAMSVLLLAALGRILASRESGGHATVQGGNATMSPKDVRHESQKFVKKVRRGNVSQLFAVILVVGVLLFLMSKDASFRSGAGRTAGGVIIAVALYMIGQVYRKGSIGAVPPEATSSVARGYYRTQLERQRAALRSVWSWYAGPMLAILLTFALQVPFAHPDEPALWSRSAPFVLLSLLWSVGFAYISRREAHKLQREIDALDKE